MERKIGQRFTHEGINLMVVEGSECIKCRLNTYSLCCDSPECRPEKRDDKADVVFIEVKK